VLCYIELDSTVGVEEFTTLISWQSCYQSMRNNTYVAAG